MIVAKVRIIYGNNYEFFDTIFNFKSNEEGNRVITEIRNNLELFLLDYCRVKKDKFPKYFEGKYNNRNKYYVVLFIKLK